MLGFSMLTLVRRHSTKLDKMMRHQLVNLYRPMKWIPCVLHKLIEGWVVRNKKIPVIIQFEEESTNGQALSSNMQAVHEMIHKDAKCEWKAKYHSLSACSCELSPNAIEELLVHYSGIKKIYYDRKVQSLLNVATPTVKSPALQQSGFTGKGVTIAVVDTGIHGHQDFTQPEDRLVGFKDFVQNRTEAYDDNGHGTHCAGDAAGNGFASGGLYQGPAYEANLVGVKVLNRMGSGSLSTVMEGIQWCMDYKDLYNIKIISLSLGAPAQQSAADDPLVDIVNKAWDNGIVVVAAAGNDGPDNGTIASPGISPKIITVGAMDDQRTDERADDRVASFSSRGPTIDQLPKPDVLAPGVNIIAPNAPGSYLYKMQKGSRVGENYLSLSGTSMATPIVAGIVAQLLEAQPNLTPDEVKQKLLNGAEDRGYPRIVQGHGYVDAEQSLSS
ncbi:S8 family peptidase [Bacillus horti]|uniref:Serine protease AprX n=1 Tax=Caldalkalibacillus horti TaxID=77523 RepID=A0ABT9VVS3_9BACI|nr:S8 family peptidase [Bacillus horti]MDQ0165071.1 serine protease AprX [Bacillus horti]